MPYVRLITDQPDKKYEVREITQSGRVVNQVYFSNDLLSFLFYRGKITQEQYDAGRLLQELHGAAPHQPSTVARYSERTGGNSEMSEQQLEHWSRYVALTRCLAPRDRKSLIDILIYNHRLMHPDSFYQALTHLAKAIRDERSN